MTAFPKARYFSESGSKARNRTVSGSSKNEQDIDHFERLIRSEIRKVDLKGNLSDWIPPAMHRSMSWSPDGQYLKVTGYSGRSPLSFPIAASLSETVLYDKKGEELSVFDRSPLQEDLPKGS